MKVIFLKNVPGAKKDQVREVSKGYALNYLFPQNLAVMASSEKIASLENKIKSEKNKLKKLSIRTEKLLKIIKNLKIEILAKANPEGHLFGGINADDLKNILKEKHNLEINKESILLKHHLKKIGQYEIPLKIDNQKINLKVIIKSE